MKIISFCLWGDNPKYCVGAIKNANLIKDIYPNWIARFYIHKDVNKKYIEEIQKTNAQIKIMENAPGWESMMWRYLPIEDAEVETFISRDTDSRLNLREKNAVDEWLNSDKEFHVMRDHPYHGFSILGGMFGAKKGGFNFIKDSIKEFKFQNQYGTDYIFFNNILYPKIEGKTLVHDEFFDKKPFPTIRLNYNFVGAIFDENDNQEETGKTALIQYLNSK